MEDINLEINKDKNFAVITFQINSMSNAEQISAMSAKILKFIEENRPNKMVIDFENVKFFSSQVLGMLLEIRAKLHRYNAELVISAINPQLHRVFMITNLDKIFRFFPDRKNAEKGLIEK